MLRLANRVIRHAGIRIALVWIELAKQEAHPERVVKAWTRSPSSSSPSASASRMAAQVMSVSSVMLSMPLLIDAATASL